MEYSVWTGFSPGEGGGGTGQGVWLPEWRAVAPLSVWVPGKQVFGEAQIVIIHIVWNGGGRGRERGDKNRIVGGAGSGRAGDEHCLLPALCDSRPGIYRAPAWRRTPVQPHGTPPGLLCSPHSLGCSLCSSRPEDRLRASPTFSLSRVLSWILSVLCGLRASLIGILPPSGGIWWHLGAVVVIKSQWVGVLLPRNFGQGSPHFSTKSSSWRRQK